MPGQLRPQCAREGCSIHAYRDRLCRIHWRAASRPVRPSPTSPEKGEGEPARLGASTPSATRSDLLAGVTGGEGAPAGQTQ